MPRFWIALVTLVTLFILGFSSSSAVAEVSIGVRATAGGGIGSAPRPVYGGAAGLDVSLALSNGWGLSATVDRVAVERPRSQGGSETQANLCVYWTRQIKGPTFAGARFWLALGGGVRRFQAESTDPLLGPATVDGFNLLHFREGVDWDIGRRVRLGVAFEWTIGGYTRARYDDSSAYLEQFDRAPPPPSASLLGGFSSIYALGPRVSFLID